MKIGFDAKRAFQNNTGLGHYSRTLIASLATYYTKNEYYLFAPKKTGLFDTTGLNNIKTITPQRLGHLQGHRPHRQRDGAVIVGEVRIGTDRVVILHLHGEAVL